MARGPGLSWGVLPDLRARLRRLCLVLGALAAAWTAIVVLTDGFVVDLGVVRLRSRTPTNPAIVAAIAAILAWVLGDPGRRRQSLAAECSAMLRGWVFPLRAAWDEGGAVHVARWARALVSRAAVTALLTAAIVALTTHVAAWGVVAVALGTNLHVPPVQSACALGCSGVLLLVVNIASRRWRMVASVAVLATFGVLTVALPLELQFAGTGFMGDGADYARNREKFERYNPAAADDEAIAFKGHLADLFLATVDRALGRTDTSPETAYKLLSRLGGVLFVAELLVVLGVLRGSRRACRYVGLALAIPLVLGFFGYYEQGYLAVSVAAFPLLLRTLRSRHQGQALEAGAGLQGLHSALHGFGLLGIAGGAVAALRARDRPLWAAARFTAWALAGYLGWVLVYIVVLHRSVEADAHSAFIAFRRLADSYYFDKRLVHPLGSWHGVSEVGMASLGIGVPLLALTVLRTRSRLERHAALLYALPGLVFLILWWPSAGVSRDLDLLLGSFAGIGAATWLASRTPRTALQAWTVLAIVHLLFWAVVADRTMERIWIAS